MVYNMVMPETNSPKKSLSDIMLAMDIVDTLRHQARLVEKELNADQQDDSLTQKIKDIYQSQGIEVTETVIADAVEALREQRFVYKAPPQGFKNYLAHLYVNRRKWTKRAGITGATGVLAYAGYYGLVEAPKAETTKQFNMIQQAVASLDFQSDLKPTATALKTIISEALDKAQLDKAKKTLVQLKQLNQLPEQFLLLKKQALNIATEEKAKKLANQYYQYGISALHYGDIKAIEQAKQSLTNEIKTLQQVYRLQIVNQPNKKSGIFRVPNANRYAKNYYLIVEALDQQNKPITLAIISEETNQQSEVNTWGVGVPKRTYDQVVRDKQNDGLIQNNIIATKNKGKLTLDYKMSITGGAITL